MTDEQKLRAVQGALQRYEWYTAEEILDVIKTILGKDLLENHGARYWFDCGGMIVHFRNDNLEGIRFVFADTENIPEKDEDVLKTKFQILHADFV